MTIDYTAILREATGSDDPDVQEWILRQAEDVEAMIGGPGADQPEAQERRTIALLRAMLQDNLADPLISTQMLALHKAAMSCLRRTADPDLSGRSFESEQRMALQLMTLATRQAALLKRSRREAAEADAAATMERGTPAAGPAAPVADPPLSRKPSFRGGPEQGEGPNPEPSPETRMRAPVTDCNAQARVPGSLRSAHGPGTTGLEAMRGDRNDPAAAHDRFP